MRVATIRTVMPRKIRIHFSIGMYVLYKCILKAKKQTKMFGLSKES